MNGNGNGNAYQDHQGEADQPIRFFWNTPVAVALKYPTGKPVEGRYGDSMFFSCIDGRRFFVPVEVGEQINALNLVPGQLVTITKSEVREGRRKVAAYKVEPGATPVGALPALPAPAGPALVSRPRPVPSTVPAASTQPSTETAAAPQPPTLRRYVYEYYKAAIDVLREAQKYGEASGFPVKFEAEDVRALAATLMIERRPL